VEQRKKQSQPNCKEGFFLVLSTYQLTHLTDYKRWLGQRLEKEEAASI
jgi:hypothetical protein